MVKQKRANRFNRAKNESDLQPERECGWHKVQNPVVLKQNELLQLTSSWTLLLCKEVFYHLTWMKKVILQMREIKLKIQCTQKIKACSCTHKKAQQIHSNKHGLSVITQLLNDPVILSIPWC